MAFNFSANDYETKSVGQSIPVLPAGVYKCIIDKCTLEPGQKSENSSNVKVLYTVTEGEFKDSKIFQNIVYENQSDAAVAIGRAMLAKICKCVNKLVLHQGPEELKGSELFVELVVENYKEKCENHLEKLAKQIAREVTKTKQPVIMDNMNSYERRIVHNTLANFKNITTFSEGEEPNRHIVVKIKED